MRYTSRKYAGYLCVALSVIIISRFIPIWVFGFVSLLIVSAIGYLLFNYLYS